ncbi:Rossmann-like fold-containing protein [Planctobacterium marinum]|uniref:25S rRNA (uridine-N(3))-methyltransferase BMT5-like domain-containing protein n=1 Tax=Planctobacterium marinum TaxID=1631968 RepID=A0AA48HEX9_9ALTE|nr:hypothetical protein MACH26_06420 [Planctobacterium marinum]
MHVRRYNSRSLIINNNKSMYLHPSWSALTIGDGDLSFSLALTQKYPDLRVCASVLDTEQEVREKYQLNAIDALRNTGHKVCFALDITAPHSFPSGLAADFDVTIFQFPLVPNNGPRKPGQSWHQGADSNLLNRRLLSDFIKHSASYFLSPRGARLCYITSKDVKPYCDWHIECLGAQSTLQYLGDMPFTPVDFHGYRVRNVDRDKQVKSTAARTYVWSDKALSEPIPQLSPPITTAQYCSLCKVGPVADEQDWFNHLNSKQHKRRAEYQQNWENYLVESD